MPGSHVKLMKALAKPTSIAAIALLTASCGGGGGSAPAPTPTPAPAPSPTPSPTPTPTPTSTAPVTITGTITYESVPFATTLGQGLNFAGASARPARFVVVEAVNASGTVLDTALTDANGDYSVTVSGNTDVRIQAKSQMRQTSGASFDFSVLDNTSGNAIYVLQGTLTSSGGANSTRNLFADSGFGTVSYTGPRTAAPFAILDTVLDSTLAIAGVTPGTNFPRGQIFWSVNNRPANGTVANGEIGTTSFTFINNIPTLLVLGDANVDTDEFDSSVIAHEFGHYAEATLGRSDSLGGSHSLNDRLDPRVALSEGYANAFSSLVRNDPQYRDSNGNAAGSDFGFNLETSNGSANRGWFSEASVQAILFDIADSANEGPDTISAGLDAIHLALSSPAYIADPAPTTIFSFLNAVRAQAGVNTGAVDALASSELINGTGSFGAGETNNGGIATALPVFNTVTIDGPAVQICSVDDAGTFNSLGNRAYLRLNVPSSQTLTITMTRTSGPTSRDPDFIIFNQGRVVARAETASANQSEQLVRQLDAGDYFIDAYDFRNLQPANNAPSGDSCYSFTVSS